MKVVEMFTDYDYTAHPRVTVRFHAGIVYTRVLECAAKEIEGAGAGRIIMDPVLTGGTVDASGAWRTRRRR